MVSRVTYATSYLPRASQFSVVEGGEISLREPLPPRVFFGRAVQAGKGPAPRHKGASVGAQRDSAVRHLRGVLVTYAILTIQNPDMWGDEVSFDHRRGSFMLTKALDSSAQLSIASVPRVCCNGGCDFCLHDTPALRLLEGKRQRWY